MNHICNYEGDRSTVHAFFKSWGDDLVVVSYDCCYNLLFSLSRTLSSVPTISYIWNSASFSLNLYWHDFTINLLFLESITSASHLTTCFPKTILPIRLLANMFMQTNNMAHWLALAKFFRKPFSEIILPKKSHQSNGYILISRSFRVFFFFLFQAKKQFNTCHHFYPTW